MQASRYVALIHPSVMEQARSLGLTNFSGFVNESLKEYIAARSSPSKDNSETATAGTHAEAAQ